MNTLTTITRHPCIKDDNTYIIEETILPVWTKGTRPKYIGKTGYYTIKVPCLFGPAPTTYRLYNPQGQVIDYALKVSLLNARARLLHKEVMT